MRINIIKYVFFLVLAISLQTTYAEPKGWNKINKGAVLAYHPKNIKQDKTFIFIIHKPISLNGKDEKKWLLSRAKNLQSSIGKALTPWKIKSEKKGGWSTINKFLNKRDKELTIAYQSISLANDQVYLLQMISSTDVMTLLEFGKQIDKVTADAIKTFSHSNAKALKNNPEPSLSTRKEVVKKKTKQISKEKRLAIEQTIRTASGKGVKPDEIIEVWVHRWTNSLLGKLSVDTYLLLKDGFVYDGLEIPPNQFLVSHSKSLEPQKWSQWKKSGSGYQIFNKKKKTWKKLDGQRAIKSQSGERLNAKYITANGSQIFGSHRNWITFKPNGRFELKSITIRSSPDDYIDSTPHISSVRTSDKKGTTAVTAMAEPQIGGGGSSMKMDGNKNRGSYSMNGYTVTLKHDNGFTHNELFFFYKANRETFIYKDESYRVDDGK